MLDEPAREIWILYAAGTAVTIFRLYSRWKVLGLRGMQWDDFLAILAIAFWTPMCYTDYTIRIENPKLSSTLLNALDSKETLVHSELLKEVPQSQIDLLMHIMKLNFASWMLKPPMVWSLKGCMVVFFLRLTNKIPWMRKLAIVTAAVVIVTFIAAEGTTLLLCVPTKDNWDIFADNWKYCSNSWSKKTEMINLLTIGITNTATDILLLIIPIPMLWQVRIPIRRKIITGFFLSSGIFIVVIVTTRLCFGMLSYSATGDRASKLRKLSFGWGMRENFTAVVVVNCLQIKPFLPSAPWKMLYSRITGSKLSTAASSRHCSESIPRTPRKPVRNPWTAASMIETKVEGGTQMKVETTMTVSCEGVNHYNEKASEDGEVYAAISERQVARDDIV